LQWLATLASINCQQNLTPSLFLPTMLQLPLFLYMASMSDIKMTNIGAEIYKKVKAIPATGRGGP
jgi:hypothetical protein